MFDFPSIKNPAFGIDLSDWSIKIANLKKRGGGFFLAGFSRQEIKEGLIEEGQIKNEAELLKTIAAAVKNVQGEKIRTRNCIVSLPETVSFVQVVNLPLMEEAEVAEAIKWELEAHIPLQLGEIYFDWQIIPSSLDCPQKNLRVLVGALPKKTVDPYLSVLAKAELKPLIFEIESVATARALIKNNPSEDPVLILDLGAKRTSLAIASDRAVFVTAGLSISNSSLIGLLAEKLGMPPDQARRFKIERGLENLDEGSQIFQALKPALANLAEQIKNYSEFYQEHCLTEAGTKNNISRVLLCGGGANLAGLAEFLSRELGLEVKTGQPLENIKTPKNSLGPEEALAFTTALGLALRNFS